VSFSFKEDSRGRGVHVITVEKDDGRRDCSINASWVCKTITVVVVASAKRVMPMFFLFEHTAKCMDATQRDEPCGPPRHIPPAG
jgi:hypothetical protein